MLDYNAFKKFLAKRPQSPIGYLKVFGLVKKHFKGIDERTITISNWRSQLIDNGHESEIKLAYEIFGTPQNTEDLNLDHLDADTATWTFIALEWLDDEAEAYMEDPTRWPFNKDRP